MQFVKDEISYECPEDLGGMQDLSVQPSICLKIKKKVWIFDQTSNSCSEAIHPDYSSLVYDLARLVFFKNYRSVMYVTYFK